MTSDTLRLINVLLSSAVVVAMIIGAMRRWDGMPVRVKRIAPWVIGTYVIIAYRSGELLAQPGETDPGLGVILFTLNLIGLLIALVWRIDEADYSDTGPLLPKIVRTLFTPHDKGEKR